MHYIIQKF